MALSNARETYFRVQRQTSYEESVSDAERERDIVDTQNGHKSCRNSRISDKDVKILATVSILALLFSVIAIAMVTVQWVIMKSSVETSGRILDDARNQEHISTEVSMSVKEPALFVSCKRSIVHLAVCFSKNLGINIGYCNVSEHRNRVR